MDNVDSYTVRMVQDPHGERTGLILVDVQSVAYYLTAFDRLDFLSWTHAQYRPARIGHLYNTAERSTGSVLRRN